MNPEVKTITDRSQYEKLLESVFADRQVFVKSGGLSAAVDSFVPGNGGITFRTGLALDGKSAILYVRRESELYFARVMLRDGSGGEYHCDIVEMYVMDLPRREARFSVEHPEKTGPAIYITGIISDFELKESLMFNKRKLGVMKSDLEDKLSKKYSKAKLFFMHEHRNDPRMDFFITERKPYLVRNVNDPAEETGNPPMRHYKTSIYTNDTALDTSFISEIAVPLLYKTMMPFGYLQVNAKEPLTDEDFSSLKKTATTLSAAFSGDDRILKCSEDKIAVIDVSMSGFGIIFKEKTFIRHFKDKSALICSIHLPGEKHAALLGEVKNITILKSGVYRVGCGIILIDPIGEVEYSEYIESMKSRTEGTAS